MAFLIARRGVGVAFYHQRTTVCGGVCVRFIDDKSPNAYKALMIQNVSSLLRRVSFLCLPRPRPFGFNVGKLFSGGIGVEELLIIGLILLIAQSENNEDIIVLLALLLFIG